MIKSEEQKKKAKEANAEFDEAVRKYLSGTGRELSPGMPIMCCLSWIAAAGYTVADVRFVGEALPDKKTARSAGALLTATALKELAIVNVGIVVATGIERGNEAK